MREQGGQAGLVAIVLAAGKGTRMRSARTKVLHEVLGRPMVAYPVAAALGAGADRVAVVVGHQREAVSAAVQAALPDADAGRVSLVEQTEQNGTGHAVMCAREVASGFGEVLIACGDTPALDAATLRTMVEAHRRSGAALTVATFVVQDPTGYGRIVRDPPNHVQRIVEHRDASDAERLIDEVNAGLYLGRADLVFGALERVGTDNAQGELYLTDVVELLARDGEQVDAFVLEEPRRVAGINTRVQLAELEAFLLAERRVALMEAGVTMHDPESVRVEAGVEIGPDTVLGPGVQLLGATRVGSGVQIDVGCVVRDTILGDGVHLKPYVVTDQASLSEGAVAGPFAHLRPGADLRERSKIGNFVEMKKTVLGPGSKANHLTYLGDTDVGQGVNIGAGTITCNYDGVNKHRTVIEDEVFIGSDTQLVAPVTVGARATVAAGTTVTRDVPPGALVLSRTKQTSIEGYDERKRKPREEAKRKQRSG